MEFRAEQRKDGKDGLPVSIVEEAHHPEHGHQLPAIGRTHGSPDWFLLHDGPPLSEHQSREAGLLSRRFSLIVLNNETYLSFCAIYFRLKGLLFYIFGYVFILTLSPASGHCSPGCYAALRP